MVSAEARENRRALLLHIGSRTLGPWSTPSKGRRRLCQSAVVSELVCVRCDREGSLTQHLALADILEGLYPPLLLGNRRRDDESDVGVAAVVDLRESVA